MKSPTKYTLLMVILWLFMIWALLLRPIDDGDIFCQIKLGELIMDQGRLITQDPFTYTLSGVKIPTVGWLAQVIFAWLYRCFSLQGVQIAHVLLYSGAFAIAIMSPILNSAKRRGDISLFSLGAAVILGFLVSLTNSSVRPQSFAVFCFAFLLYVVQSNWRFRTKLLALAPTLLLWQNTHPSVMIGVLAMAVLVFLRWIRNFTKSDNAKPWDISLFLLISVLALLFTPLGWHIFDISTKNAQASREWLGITEWLPPWHESVRDAMLVFWIALILSVCLVINLRNKLRFIDVALFVSFTLLTLYAARFALFWAIIMVPIWASWIEQAKPVNLFSWRGDLPISKWILAITLVIGITIVSFLVYTMRQAIIDQKTIPAQGIAFLKSVLARGRIYNYPVWGGPLIFAGYPQWHVTVDGRLYLYEKTFWIDYFKAAQGKIPLQELVKQHQPDAFFLHPRFHQQLIEILGHSQNWCKLYSDAQCIIFLPCSKVRE
jgi:hypothetical protein